MNAFESTKAQFIAAIQRLMSERSNCPNRGVLLDWIPTITDCEITALRFSFDPRELYGHFTDDEIVFSKTFRFYQSDYLRECCAPGEDCLAGKRCIPIGSVDGSDEFIYICDDSSIGIAHLHHDDVYLAKDLDEVVYEKATRLNKPLLAFVECLMPETNLVKFSASGDASKWLVVEDLGRIVRYEMNLNKEWRDGEQHFDSPAESERFFFDVIQQGLEITSLSIIDCPPQLEDKIKSLIEA